MSYKCSVCLHTFQLKEDIIKHTEKEHSDKIPEGMSVAQFIYAQNHNGRTTGLCRFCHKPTEWSETLGKPRQICNSPECAAYNRKLADERTKKIYGKTGAEMLSDPEHQKMMLANRSISGIYNWSDGVHKFTYTGSYEKFIIEWLDKVMGINPETVQMPGLVIPYEYKGEKHMWITDIYLSDFNLIVEVKDGLENKHDGFAENREKEKAKDNAMKTQKEFNYIKITHKNVMQLVKILSEIRMNNILSKENKTNFIAINEAADASSKTILLNNLRSDLQDEFTAIKGYEEHADICEKEGLTKAAEVLRDISKEEKVHCGEIGALLKIHDDQYDESIKDGEKEADETIDESASVNVLNGIRADLQGEFDAIKNYDSHIEYAMNMHADDIVKVLSSIRDEEKQHVGELLKVLSIYDDEFSKSIKDGEKEADETITESAENESELYFLSSKNMDGETLSPRIPDNFLIKNGYEDGSTPRVCFAPTINQCLMGLSQNLTGKEFYVHVPVGKYDVVKPDVTKVPDVNITGETWVTSNVKIKCIGKIKVSGDSGKAGHKYTYGDGKTAELYDWEYDWTDIHNNRMEPLTEEAKYDPPYNANQIKQNYGEEMYLKLSQDNAHKWRMDTGIELIHQEPTKTELNRIWSNWNLMSDELKKKSDAKSMELFGMSNEDHYKKLINNESIEFTSSGVSSTLDKNHSQNGKKSLSEFKKINATKDMVDHIMKFVHLSDTVENTFNNENTIIFEDNNGDVVATVSANKPKFDKKYMNRRWLTYIEVAPKYRGYGLSDQLLDFAIDEMHVNTLGVSKKNEIAMRLYKKHGFEIWKENPNNKSQYWMYLKGTLTESWDAGIPKTCPKCGSKVGLYFKGEPVYLCSNKKCNKYFGVKSMNESIGTTLLSNDAIESLCETIYAQAEDTQELTELIPIIEEKPKTEDKYDLLAKKYALSNEDVFDDGKGDHAPMGYHLSIIPGEQFVEKEDCQQDPSASDDGNVLATIASDTLNSNLELKEETLNIVDPAVKAKIVKMRKLRDEYLKKVDANDTGSWVDYDNPEWVKKHAEYERCLARALELADEIMRLKEKHHIVS